ncbi:MAG: hypothetical protein ABI720_10665 [Actinomycetes bacterium]
MTNHNRRQLKPQQTLQDLDVRVINAVTGELLRELTIDPDRDYQPKKQKGSDPQMRVRIFPVSCEITFVAGAGFDPATSGL